jgi:hypothetical protein
MGVLLNDDLFVAPGLPKQAGDARSTEISTSATRGRIIPMNFGKKPS